MSASPNQPHQHDKDECSRVLTHINDYIDHKLSPDLCEELEAHLAECENCRVVFDTLNKTLYLVHQLREQPPQLPESVEYRLFAVMQLDQFTPRNKKKRK
jgi:predicted anti-sigma-YlaC factor YlaD